MQKESSVIIYWNSCCSCDFFLFCGTFCRIFCRISRQLFTRWKYVMIVKLQMNEKAPLKWSVWFMGSYSKSSEAIRQTWKVVFLFWRNSRLGKSDRQCTFMVHFFMLDNPWLMYCMFLSGGKKQSKNMKISRWWQNVHI